MQPEKSGATKRPRQILSSSETEESHPPKQINAVMSRFEKEISGRLTNIETQLAKLDKLEVIKNLLAEISALKASVDFANNQNADLRKENKALEKNIKELKTTTASIQKENKLLNNAVLELKCRSMGNNIVISGLEEDEKGGLHHNRAKGDNFLERLWTLTWPWWTFRGLIALGK